MCVRVCVWLLLLFPEGPCVWREARLRSSPPRPESSCEAPPWRHWTQTWGGEGEKEGRGASCIITISLSWIKLWLCQRSSYIPAISIPSISIPYHPYLYQLQYSSASYIYTIPSIPPISPAPVSLCVAGVWLTSGRTPGPGSSSGSGFSSAPTAACLAGGTDGRRGLSRGPWRLSGSLATGEENKVRFLSNRRETNTRFLSNRRREHYQVP